MFGITELPRVDGIVQGDFLAKHASESFAHEAFGFKFVDGVTVEPVRGIIPSRLHAAFGDAVQFLPCSRVDGLAAIGWMVERGEAQARVEEACNALDALFPEPKEELADDEDDGDEKPKAKKGKSTK